ncbi:MAG: hypothetical protein QOK04_447 [Solirubrobacteraceae bacterium]|jgi:plastocyanin|nr:hypothetical protein [Solirubrobacteraceae bacterium]
MNSSHLRRTASCVVVAVGLIALAGCGGSSTKSQLLKVSETDVGAKQYAYQGITQLKPGTVTIEFTNSGKVPHEFQLLRADSGHSEAELKATLTKLVESQKPLPVPSWFHAAGGVGAIGPGASSTAKVVLKAGTYYAADTQTPPNSNNVPPFLTQGAFAPIEAKGSKVGGALPSESKHVTVKDVGKDKFRFDNSPLKAGTVTVEFNNTSKQDHHVIALPLLPGKTIADVKKALASNGPPSGPPPVDFAGQTGTAIVDYKQKEVAQLHLAKAGNYVLLCFLTDRNGKGKPHFQEGLLKEVKVS